MPDLPLSHAIDFASTFASQASAAPQSTGASSLSAMQQLLSAGAPAPTQAPANGPQTTAQNQNTSVAWLDPQTGDVVVAGHHVPAADTQTMRAAADAVAKAGGKAPQTPTPGAGWLPIDPTSLAAHAQFMVQNQSYPLAKNIGHSLAESVHNLPQTLEDLGGNALHALNQAAQGQTINSLGMSGALNNPDAAARVAQVTRTGAASDAAIDQTLAAHPAPAIPMPQGALHPTYTPAQQVAMGPDASTSSQVQGAIGGLAAFAAPALLTEGAGALSKAAVAAQTMRDSDVAAALSGAGAAVRGGSATSKLSQAADILSGAGDAGAAAQRVASAQRTNQIIDTITGATAQGSMDAQMAEGGDQQAREEAQQQLATLPPAKLAALPQYKQLVSSGLSDAQARTQLVSMAGQGGAAAGAATGLLYSMMMAGLLPKAFDNVAAKLPTVKGAGIAARVGRAALTGAENAALTAGATKAQSAAGAQQSGLPAPVSTGNGGAGAAGIAGALLGLLAPGHGVRAPRSVLDTEAAPAAGAPEDLSDIQAAMNDSVGAPKAAPETPAPAADPAVKATQPLTPEGVEAAATGTAAPNNAPAPSAAEVQQAAQGAPAQGPQAAPTPEALQAKLAEITQAMATTGRGSVKYRQLRLARDTLAQQLKETQAAPAAPAAPAAGPAGEPAAPPSEAAPQGDRPNGVAPQPIPAAIPPEQAAQQAQAEAARGNPMPETPAAPASPVAAAAAAPAPVAADDTALPSFGREHGNPKPRYGARQVAFSSDVDRALYTVANRKELSKADPKMMAFLRTVPGLDDATIMDEAKRVKAAVKEAAGPAGTGNGDAVKVPPVYKAPARDVGSVAATAPEPVADIKAQLSSVAKGEKRAAWVPTGQERTVPGPYPRGVFRVLTPEGTLFTKDVKLRTAFTKAPKITEAMLADALGYSMAKADAVDSGEPPVAVRVSRAGKVLHEEMTTPSQVDAVRAKLRDQFKRGAKIEVTTPTKVVADRAQRVAEEKPPVPKPQAGVEAPAPAEPTETAPIPATPHGQPELTDETRNGIAAHLQDIAKREEAAQTPAHTSDFVRLMQQFGATRNDHAPVGAFDLHRLRGNVARGSADDARAMVDRFYENGGRYPEPHDVGAANRVPADAGSNGPMHVGAQERAPQIGTGRLFSRNGMVEAATEHPDIVRAAATVGRWVDMLRASGLHFFNALRIMSSDDYLREYGGNPEAFKTSGGFMGYRKDANGTLHAVIVIKTPPGRAWAAPQVQDLAHEMGHYVETQLYPQLDDATQKAIVDAHKAWFLSVADKSLKDTVLSRVGAARQADIAAAPENLTTREYATAFSEWFADHVGRWFTTAEKPHSAVERYFSTIARVLKSLWSKLSDEFKLPHIAVQQMMDSMVADAVMDRAGVEATMTRDQHTLAPSDVPPPEPEVSLADAVRARARGVSEGARGVTGAVVDAARRVASGDFTGVRDATRNARESQTSSRTRQVALWMRPLNWFGEMAAAKGMRSAEWYRAIGVAYDKADARTAKLMVPADLLVQKVMKRSPEARQLLQAAMYEASTHGVALDKPWAHPENTHLHSPDKQVEAANYATWQRGQARFAQLKTAGVDGLYTAMRDYTRRLYELQLDHAQGELEKLAMDSAARSDGLDRIGQLRKAMMQGDYWPKVRDGNYIVKSVIPQTRVLHGDNPDGTFSSAEMAEAERNRLRALNPHAEVTVKKFETDEDEPDAYAVWMKVPAVWMHKSLAEARNARESMMADLKDAWTRMGYGQEFDEYVKENGDPLSPVRQKTHIWQYDKAVPPAFLRNIDTMVENHQIGPHAAQTLRDLYVHSLTEGSFLKTNLRDRNVLGASKSMLQGWARRMSQSAYHVSRLEAREQLDDQWHSLEKAAQADLNNGFHHAVTDYNEFYRMHTAYADELKDDPLNRLAGTLSDVSTIATMGLSPKYLVLQAPQPWITTLPLLAGKFGVRSGAGYLRDAYDGLGTYYTRRGIKEFVDSMRRMAGATSKYDPAAESQEALVQRVARTPEEASMMRELFSRGVLDFNWNNHLRDVATSGAGQNMRNLLRMSMAFNSQIEAVNRVVSAMAAYRAGRKEAGMSHGEAVEFAQQVADKSQGNYRMSNRSAFLRGVSGKTIGKFKLWTLNMYHLLAEQVVKSLQGSTRQERLEGMRTLGYLLSTHAAIAGLAGLGPIYAAAQLGLYGTHKAAVAMGLQDPGLDDYKDSDTLMHDFWASVGDKLFGAGNGQRFARDLENGPLNELGLDMSEMSGIPKLLDTKYAGTRPTDSGYDRVKANLFAMAGPAVDTPLRAIGDALDGRATDAASRFAPAWARFIYRAAKLDLTNSPTGNRSIFQQGDEAKMLDVAAQALGIPSSHVNEAYDENDRLRSTAAEIQAAAQRITQAYARNPDDPEVQKRIARFNASVPGPFQITSGHLQSALANRPSKTTAYLKSQEP